MKKNLGRIVYFVSTVFLVLSTVFFVVRMAPGDPVERILGPESSREEVEWYRSQLKLDRSVWVQYRDFMKGFLSGDMGESLFKKKKTTQLLKEHLPSTLVLAVTSILFSILVGVAGGMFCVLNKSRGGDILVRILSLIFLSFPIFSLAPLLVLVFAVKLRWLPVSEWNSLSHGVLPVLALVIPLSSILMRVMRNKYLDEMNAPWVRVLYSKGLGEGRIRWHLIRVCLPTILNVVAVQLAVVLTGTMITESIFDIPGVGMLLFEGIQNRDYPVVQSVIAYSTLVYMAIYFLVDFLNEWIDPRIEEG